jgi:hypothetical protein
MKIEFSEAEMEILRSAVKEYEESHYENEGREWQDIINRLMDRIR